MKQYAIVIVFICLGVPPLLRADTPSTSPSTAPTTAPTTAAAAAAATQSADTTAVVKGTVVANVEVDGWFEPVDPLEVRFRPESYQGELKIKSAAAHGASVKQGDVILTIDSTNLAKQLAEAENALLAAKANLTKAEADDYLGEQADALALAQAREELTNAEASLKWFEEVDGKQMLTSAELGTKNARANVEDQNDELEQLRKMYKTEELTNATADIVVKRSLRQLEISKVMQGLTEMREGKVKNFDYNVSRQRLVFNIDQEKQQLAQLKAAQDQQKVIRKTGVTSARLAADKAETKLNELRADNEALTVHAPFDGVVYYGQLSGGNWQNANPKALRPGERIPSAPPGQVVMTVVRPGKLRLLADIPESKLGWIEPGKSEARVVPTALPEATGTAKCVEVSPTAGGGGFQARFDLANIDPRLAPGMKASLRIDAGAAKDVLVVPVAAVSKGRVKVRENGKDVWRDVIVGKSDNDLVEIKQGLKEGELLVTKGGK